MELLIHVEGATEADREHGVAAAQRVFANGRASAPDCAWAVFNRDRYAEQGFVGRAPSKEQARWASLWEEAEQAGIKACCSRMPAAPEGSYLELRFGETRKPANPTDRGHHGGRLVLPPTRGLGKSEQ